MAEGMNTTTRILDIEIPKGFMNVAVSGKFLVADTNDSANWDTLKFPLPEGKWKVQYKEGKLVRLVCEDR